MILIFDLDHFFCNLPQLWYWICRYPDDWDQGLAKVDYKSIHQAYNTVYLRCDLATSNSIFLGIFLNSTEIHLRKFLEFNFLAYRYPNVEFWTGSHPKYSGPIQKKQICPFKCPFVRPLNKVWDRSRSTRKIPFSQFEKGFFFQRSFQRTFQMTILFLL